MPLIARTRTLWLSPEVKPVMVLDVEVLPVPTQSPESSSEYSYSVIPPLLNVGADQVIDAPLVVAVGVLRTGAEGTVNGLFELVAAEPCADTEWLWPEESSSQVDPLFNARSSLEFATGVNCEVGTEKLALLYSEVPFTKWKFDMFPGKYVLGSATSEPMYKCKPVVSIFVELETVSTRSPSIYRFKFPEPRVIA